MFGHNHYVPILKWKLGEQLAIRELSEEDRQKTTPLIEVPPVDWDYGKEQPRRTIAEHLQLAAKALKKEWTDGNRIFVDLGALDDGELLPDGRHIVTTLFEDEQLNGLHVVPVAGNGHDEAHSAAVISVAKARGQGCCIRLTRETIYAPRLDEELTQISNYLELELDQIDIIFDLGSIAADEVEDLLRATAGQIVMSKNIDEVRSLTVATSAFPENVSRFKADTIGVIPRHDWQFWSQLSQSRLPNRPAFGDYGANHPSHSEFNPRMMSTSANIRYCSDKEWVILRGHKLSDKLSYEQFYSLSAKLISDNRYAGSEFSWADGYIQKCAEKTANTGNLTTWRQVATNRHIKCTLDQLSTFA